MFIVKQPLFSLVSVALLLLVGIHAEQGGLRSSNEIAPVQIIEQEHRELPSTSFENGLDTSCAYLSLQIKDRNNAGSDGRTITFGINIEGTEYLASGTVRRGRTYHWVFKDINNISCVPTGKTSSLMRVHVPNGDGAAFKVAAFKLTFPSANCAAGTNNCDDNGTFSKQALNFNAENTVLQNTNQCGHVTATDPDCYFRKGENYLVWFRMNARGWVCWAKTTADHDECGSNFNYM